MCKFTVLLAFPMVISAFSQLLYGAINTAIVGRYSIDGLAGITAGVSTYSVFAELIGAALIGYQITASRKIGAEKFEDVGKSLVNTFYLVMPIAFAIVAMLLTVSKDMVAIIAEGLTERDIASQYIVWRAPGLLFFTVSLLLQTTYDSFKKSKYGMYATLGTNVLNIPLTYLMIFGGFGITELGAAGSGLASSISTFVGMVIHFIIFFSQGYHQKLSLKFNLKFNREEAKSLTKLTWPELVTSCFVVASDYVFFALVGLIGMVGLAGGRIGFLCFNILFIISLRLSIALQILMGRSLGRSDHEQFLRYLKRGGIFILLVMTVIGGLLFFLPKQILMLFTDFTEVQEATLTTIQVIGLSAPVTVAAVLFTAALRAMKKTKFIMYVNLISVWLVQLPVAWFLGIKMEMGMVGLFLGFTAYFSVRSILGYIFYKLNYKTYNQERTQQVSA